MKKNIKLFVAAIVLWIPLSYVVFIHSDDEIFQRILISIASGPILLFCSVLGALAVSFLFLGSNYVLGKIGWDKVDNENFKEILTYSFNGSFGVILVVLYYFTISNQHLFFRIYGGW